MVKNMKHRSVKHCGRRSRAAFGADGAVMAAATLAAAAMNVAATNNAASTQAQAAKDSARSQADAVERSARLNSEALNKQTQNNNDLQNKSIELSKELHKEQMDKQNEIQMNLQMLTGQQSMEDRKRSSMQVVKYGGRGSNKLSLRGSNNTHFNITDGGGVKFMGFTPEGYELYQFVGDTHNQTHTLPNGKKASGVGVDLTSTSNSQKQAKKYGGNADVEAEGGEYALAVPNDVLFISKHNIGGFNPAKAIEQGVNPVDAFNAQENIKNNIGKRKLRLVGGTSAALNNVLTEGLDNLSINDVTTGVASQTDGVRKLKCGGRVHARRKADKGLWWSTGADLAGAGLSTLGNIWAANKIAGANTDAANMMANAYGRAADIMATAYGNMTGIDPSILSKEDYAAAHYMPAIRNYQVSAAPETTAVNRSANRKINAINRRSLSSAAALNRIASVEEDRVNKIAEAYDRAERASETIKQENNRAINEAARQNAVMDMQAMQDYTDAKIDLAKYNNNIENSKLAGIAEAKSGAITQSAGALGSAKQANAQTWGNAITNSANALGSAVSAFGKRYYETQQTLAGADTTARLAYIAKNGTNGEKQAEIDRLKNLIDNEDDPKLQNEYKKQLGIFGVAYIPNSFDKLKPIEGTHIYGNITGPSFKPLNSSRFADNKLSLKSIQPVSVTQREFASVPVLRTPSAINFANVQPTTVIPRSYNNRIKLSQARPFIPLNLPGSFLYN